MTTLPISDGPLEFTGRPQRDTLVGIDSDGCVFDTMEAKQKQCFHEEIVSRWGLRSVEKEVRRMAEFVGLYSVWRGSNRWVALVKLFELLEQERSAGAFTTPLPDLSDLRDFAHSGRPLSRSSLYEEAERRGSDTLRAVYAWSEAVNVRIARLEGRFPPFEWARRTLEKMRRRSDLIVVSQTPVETLQREWRAHGLDAHLRGIAGQEMGTKQEQLVAAARGRYAPNRVLMIGDAPGDLQAAQAAQTRFYPIQPGQEETSWKRLHEDVYARFLAGAYTEASQRECTVDFEALLPCVPPWWSLNQKPEFDDVSGER